MVKGLVAASIRGLALTGETSPPAPTNAYISIEKDHRLFTG